MISEPTADNKETNIANKDAGFTLFDKDFKEITVTQFVSLTGGLMAGTILSTFSNNLLIVPGLFVLYPGFLALKGEIHGSLCARLSSALHIGDVKVAVNAINNGKNNNTASTREISHKDKKKTRHILFDNIVASLLLGIFVSIILGIAAYAVVYFIFKINNPEIILLSVLAATIANIVMIPFTIYSTLWVYKHGYDPDNIMGSYITTVGDVVGVLSLIVGIVLLI
ncbi:magnesium transporter [Candidatus Woesearchaeota archaeon]|nr:magnesium transporter [Candidatus Woesearchaeota archaeon]